MTVTTPFLPDVLSKLLVVSLLMSLGLFGAISCDRSASSENVDPAPTNPAKLEESPSATDPPAIETTEETPESPKAAGPEPSDTEEDDEHHAPKVRIPPPSQEVIDRLPADGGQEFNRLVFEKSPYLLQHARNPVDWYPWGPEAFEKAEKEGKPIFLSIGYSTCHWCHVMEHESFEDDEVAKILNENFVPIKLDREEREDVDSIYMAVCLAMNGSGGWPLSIFMTADRKPFYAGTYIPKDDRANRPGFISLMKAIDKAWTSDRQDVLDNAEKLTKFMVDTQKSQPSVVLGEETFAAAYEAFESRFDSTYGGFGKSPKFPSPHDYTFLLRYWYRTGEERAREIVAKSLQAMRNGGIFDHVGFGFHRYSTDQKWLVPHFEKMLYDQATLTLAYTDAYLATGDESFSQVVREIGEYVLRDMTSPKGGFYSAEDADSEGEEGKFYLWSTEELIEVLGKQEGELFGQIFGCFADGNFKDESTGKITGTNILHLKKSLVDEAKDRGLDPDELTARWSKARAKLFEVRKKRIHPLKDDKILTAWNGLMIAGFARAGKALDEPRFVDAAARAASFINNHLIDRSGRLLRRFRDDEGAHIGYLDDYAFLVWGLIELYEATFDLKHLEMAENLNKEMLALFLDEKGGGLFFTGHDGEKLLLRRKEIYDGAVPSGNSVAAHNFLRLARLLGSTDLEKQADNLIASVSGEVQRVPSGYGQFLSSLDFSLGPSREIVIVGPRGRSDTDAMLQAVSNQFLPRQVVLFHPHGEDKAVKRLPEYARSQKMVGDKATAYVCQNFACDLPVNDVLALVTKLQNTPKPIRKKTTESEAKTTGDASSGSE